MRTQVHPKLGTLEQKIENLHISLNSQAHREHLITLINNIHEKLDKADEMRILTSDENLAKHNALISVCTAGSGDSYPFEDYDNDVNDGLDDPRNTRAPRPVNPTEIVNSTPCPNKIDFTPFKKFLRICPSQSIEILSEIRTLGSHYKLIDRSLSTIQDTLEEIETDQLMAKLTKVSTFTTHEFAEISRTLEFIQVK